MRRTRTITVSAGAAALVMATAAGSAAGGAPDDPPLSATQHSAPAHDDGTCRPLPVVSTTLVQADGHRLRADLASERQRATSGVRTTYRQPDGSTVWTVTPPADFRPQTASVRTDRAFGFDPPQAGTRLAAWRQQNAQQGRTIPSVPCVDPQAPKNYPIWNSVNSGWSGFVAIRHRGYHQVSANTRIPRWGSRCGANVNTSTSAWVGLGGAWSRRLIQEGVAAGSSQRRTLGGRMWYELLNRYHANNPVYIGGTRRTGDAIALNMSYHGGTVVFHWYDRTTHRRWAPVHLHGRRSYYDGKTAEWVVEKSNGFMLRKFRRINMWNAAASYGRHHARLFHLPHGVANLRNSSGQTLIGKRRTGVGSFRSIFRRCA